MPLYDYEAKLVSGTLAKGQMDAMDEESVKASLRSKNEFPVMVRESGKLNIDLSAFQHVRLKDIAIFCRQFSYMLVSGMNVLDTLGILKLQTSNKKLSKAINSVYEDVQKGKSLSAAMEKQSAFPGMLINMVSVGESGGNLDEMMLRMADYYDREFQQRQKVKQALTYPIIVLIFALIVVNFLVIAILPQILGDMMNNTSKLPMPTQVVIAVSRFMRNYWFVMLLIVLFLIFFIKLKGKGERNINLDKFKLSIPVFGKINMKIAAAKFARTFGMLLSSGMPMINSIEICAKSLQNAFIEKNLIESTDDIKKGYTLSYSLSKKKMFTPMLIQMVKVGEESGSLDDILSKTAEYYDREVETATNQMTTLIEPFIIILLAFMVGFIIVSIVLPILQLYDSV